MEGNKTNKEKITLSLDKDLIKRAKHEAVGRDTDVSALVEEALEMYLKKTLRNRTPGFPSS